MSSAIVRKKLYALNYPKDVLDIISKMSFSKGANVEVGGSMGLKSQQYAGDYDLTETVVGQSKSKEAAADIFAAKFQDIVKGLLQTKGLILADIKCGVVPEWKILDGAVRDGRVVGYSAAKSRSRLLNLKPFLSATDFAEAQNLIKSKPTAREFYKASDLLKFHIIRWTPAAIIRGFVILIDGRHYTLAQAINSPSIAKLDVIAYIQRSRFTDFSIIYTFKNAKDTLNGLAVNPEFDITDSLFSYLSSDNYFKAAKRLLSIARLRNDIPLVSKLTDMFNSDLGRLYSIISDATTILYLLENKERVSIDKIRYEIDQFRSRLGNIYSIGRVGSERILESLLSMQELPADTKGRMKLMRAMQSLVNYFSTVLNTATESYMKENNIWNRLLRGRGESGERLESF